MRRLTMAGREIAEIGFSQPDDVVKAVDEAETLMFSLAQGEIQVAIQLWSRFRRNIKSD